MIATALTLLMVLIGLSIPVGAALGLLGLILDPLYSMLPLSSAMGELAWSTNNEFLLVAIPLFIMLGEVLLRAGFAERMYSAMSLWLLGLFWMCIVLAVMLLRASVALVTGDIETVKMLCGVRTSQEEAEEEAAAGERMVHGDGTKGASA